MFAPIDMEALGDAAGQDATHLRAVESVGVLAEAAVREELRLHRLQALVEDLPPEHALPCTDVQAGAAAPPE